MYNFTILNAEANNICFLWDLDGTLIDSYKVIASSIESILNKNNLFISYEDIDRTPVEETDLEDELSDLDM